MPKVAKQKKTLTKGLLQSLAARDQIDALNLQAQALLEFDHPQALVLIEQARDLSVENDYQIGFAESLLNLCQLNFAQNDIENAILVVLQAKNIFKNNDNNSKLLESLLLSGKYQRNNDQIDISSVSFEEGVDLSRQFLDQKYEADFLNERAINSSITGNYIDAIEKYQNVLRIRRKSNDLRGISVALINIGADLTNLGNYSDSLEASFQAYEIIEKNLNDPQLKSRCLLNIGNTYQDMGNNKLSIENYNKVLKISKENKDKYIEIMCLNNIGESNYFIKNFKTALKVFKEALKKSKNYKIQDLETFILNGLGKTHSQLQNFTEAIGFQQKSLELAQQSGDQQSMINALIGLGDAHFGLHQNEIAAKYFLQSLNLSHETKQPKTAYEAHQKLADVYQRLGNFLKTIEHLREYHRLEREVLNQETAQKTRNLTLQFDLERARHEAEVYRVQNEAMERANDLLEEKVRERTTELEEARVEIVMRLAMAAEYRDDSTGQHTLRVGRNSALLAQALGLPSDQVELMRSAARLHDVGKIGITDLIMLKPSKLTFDEFERMKTHTTIGATMLSNGQSPLLKMAETIALTHHERFDGSGYPKGLTAEEIPLVGRIVAVADVYDALRCERPYKRAWSVKEARAEIATQAGKHFDTQVVDAFLKLLDDGVDLG